MLNMREVVVLVPGVHCCDSTLTTSGETLYSNAVASYHACRWHYVKTRRTPSMWRYCMITQMETAREPYCTDDAFLCVSPRDFFDGKFPNSGNIHPGESKCFAAKDKSGNDVSLVLVGRSVGTVVAELVFFDQPPAGEEIMVWNNEEGKWVNTPPRTATATATALLPTT
jgi:hypothetical protein